MCPSEFPTISVTPLDASYQRARPSPKVDALSSHHRLLSGTCLAASAQPPQRLGFEQQ